MYSTAQATSFQQGDDETFLYLGLPLMKQMHLYEITAKITQFLSYGKIELFQIF